MHTTAGYLLGTAMTHKYVFDYHENEIYSVRTSAGSQAIPTLSTDRWQMGHDSDVRRSADLSGQFTVLASRGQAPGQYFLHRTQPSEH